jgi:hypothetical protein
MITWVLTGRPKRLLVIVNPFGGDKSGRRVYTTSVEPLLKAAGIAITMEGALLSSLAWELKNLDCFTEWVLQSVTSVQNFVTSKKLL